MTQAGPDRSEGSGIAVRPLRPLPIWLTSRPLLWFTLATWLVYSIYCVGRYPQFLTAGYDLGIFDQAVRRYSRFEAPLVALKGDNYHLLGDHFHPILAVLAPLYWIWDDPRMLVIAQAGLVSLSVPIVHGMMRRHGASGVLLWILTVGYAFSWPIQRLVDFDFHEISFAVPLLALALDGLDRRDDRRFLVGALPLLLVREDMGMVLAMLGIVRAWLAIRDHREVRRMGQPRRSPHGSPVTGRRVGSVSSSQSRVGSSDPRALHHTRADQSHATGDLGAGSHATGDLGAGSRTMLGRALALSASLVVLGTVVFFLVIKVVLPHFAADGQFAYWTYDSLGADAVSSIKFILLHPIKTAVIFFTPWVKTQSLLYLLVPLAFLPLRSPYVLATLPLLAQRNLSSRTHLWGTSFHYSGPIFVILVFACADALARMTPDWRRRVAKYLAAMVFITPAFDLAVQGRNYPLVRLTWSAWRKKPIMIHQQAVLQHIPPHTCLEVDDRLAPHLTRTNRVTLPTLTKRTSDFVVLDMSQNEVGYPLPSPQEIEERVKSRGYTPVAQEGPIVVWQRPGYAGPSDGCRPDAP
ncbi:DUF2079 domain-containing protein [Luteococcus sp. Sow4_B9]|uniref:DUF2079 domain-containing protein n=1 Tax=Luteococcus sp. Sow4_B9 TaxID=3438792 RepID=UPI003F9C1EE1